MVRTELREHIFKLVFQLEFHTPEEMPEYVTLYLDNLEGATDKDKTYIANKYEAVAAKVSQIDEMINEI